MTGQGVGEGAPDPRTADLLQQRVPLPIGWEMEKHQDAAGRTVVRCVIVHPMGTTVVWFDNDGARRFADQLRETATGIVVPPSPSM